MKLPSPSHICGIDPGFEGALAFVSSTGLLAICDMPVVENKKDRKRLLDLPALWDILNISPVGTHVVLELPNARPHEAPNACFRFGMQIGILQGMIHAAGLRLTEVSPAKWCADLCCPGKDHPGWLSIREQRILELGGPDLLAACRGPRGGLKDGRCDAVLLGLWGLGRRPRFNGAS